MFQKSIFLVFATFVFALAAAGQETGSVKGKVRTKDGKGIASATVTARKDGEDKQSTKTDKSGNFRLSDLPLGTYDIRFEKDGYTAGVIYEVIVKKKKTNNLRDRLILRIDDGTLILLEASVFNPNGLSLYGAKVVVEVIHDDGSSKEVASGYTSRDGDILFRFPVGATKYLVTASAKKAKASKTVEVNEAAIYRTAITLDLSEEN